VFDTTRGSRVLALSRCLCSPRRNTKPGIGGAGDAGDTPPEPPSDGWPPGRTGRLVVRRSYDGGVAPQLGLGKADAGRHPRAGPSGCSGGVSHLTPGGLADRGPVARPSGGRVRGRTPRHALIRRDHGTSGFLFQCRSDPGTRGGQPPPTVPAG